MLRESTSSEHGSCTLTLLSVAVHRFGLMVESACPTRLSPYGGFAVTPAGALEECPQTPLKLVACGEGSLCYNAGNSEIPIFWRKP